MEIDGKIVVIGMISLIFVLYCLGSSWPLLLWLGAVPFLGALCWYFGED